jgi:hypothetical protein
MYGGVYRQIFAEHGNLEEVAMGPLQLHTPLPTNASPSRQPL